MISRRVYVTGPTLSYMVDKENTKYKEITINILGLSYWVLQLNNRKTNPQTGIWIANKDLWSVAN